jgi:hypothetical protein
MWPEVSKHAAACVSQPQESLVQHEGGGLWSDAAALALGCLVPRCSSVGTIVQGNFSQRTTSPLRAALLPHDAADCQLQGAAARHPVPLRWLCAHSPVHRPQHTCHDSRWPAPCHHVPLRFFHPFLPRHSGVLSRWWLLPRAPRLQTPCTAAHVPHFRPIFVVQQSPIPRPAGLQIASGRNISRHQCSSLGLIPNKQSLQKTVIVGVKLQTCASAPPTSPSLQW